MYFNFFDTIPKEELSQVFIDNREFLENLKPYDQIDLNNYSRVICSPGFDIKHKIYQNIINQMTLPVNWLAVCDYIKLKNTFTIECGPNKVLTKLCQSNDIQNVFDSSLESLNNLIQSSYE